MLKKAFITSALSILTLANCVSAQTITSANGGTAELDPNASTLVFRSPSKDSELLVACKNMASFIVYNLEKMTGGMNEISTPEYAPMMEDKENADSIFKENMDLKDDLFKAAALCPSNLYPGANKEKLDQAYANFNAAYKKTKAALAPK